MTTYTALCPITVGRGTEVHALRQNAGTRRTTFVAGPAGIGKSRLAAEAIAIARELGLEVLSGYCTPEQSVPYAPFVRAVRRRTRGMEPDQLAEAFSGASSLAAALVPEVGSAPLEAPPQADLFAAVWRLLSRLGGARGALLLLEDLHWCDVDTAELLTYLARESDELPIWLVATYRGDEVHRRHHLAPMLATLARERRFDEITLAPLDPEELRSMIAAILGDAPVGEEFLAAMLERTQGNPFFVEELLKVLMERGDVFQEADATWSRRDLAEIEMPGSVREALLTRIRTLSPEALDLLHLAALQGQRMDLAVLVQASGLSAAEVDDVVAEGLRMQLLAEQHDPSGDYYVFRHALTREALGDELVGPERRAGHLRLARAIETAHAEALDAHAADLADHFAAGGDQANALEWGQVAAARAAASFAFDDASRRYEGVLSMMGHDDARRLDVLEAAYGATIDGPDRRFAVAFAVEARQLAHARAARASEARALSALASDAAERGESPASVELLEEALTLVHGHDDALEGTVLATLCRQLTRADQIEEALERTPGAMAHAARTGNDRALGSLRITSMMNASTDGEFQRSLREARDAVLVATDVLGEYQLSQTAGYICLWRGDLEQSRSLFARAIELKERIRPHDLYTHAGFAWALSLRGEYDEARAQARRASASTSVPTRIVALTALAEVEARELLGDRGTVVEELTRLTATSRESQRSVPALAARARHAVTTSRVEELGSSFWELLELTTSARGRGSHWLFSPDFAVALLDAELVDELARWAVAVAAVTGNDPHAHNTAADAWVQGALAAARGDGEVARRRLEDASSQYASMPCPARSAEVELTRASIELRLGDNEESARAALAGRALASSCGANALVARAESLLLSASPATRFATLLFTDIVGSTERLAAVGDLQWRSLRERHDTAIRRLVERHGGTEVDETGDGFFLAFDSPTQAISCAAGIREAMTGIGIEVRAGLHAGECQVVGSSFLGFAVHLAARVCAEATASQVLVTSTVRELTVGSSARFTDVGERVMKGVPDAWRLYLLEGV